MDQEKIGCFIGEIRRQHGFTQGQLAEKIGVSNKTISKWECGKGLPEVSLLLPLCNALEITVPELLSGEKKKQSNVQPSTYEIDLIQLVSKEQVHMKKKFRAGAIFTWLLGLLFLLGFILLTQQGLSGFQTIRGYYWDSPTFFVILIFSLILVAPGITPGFRSAVSAVFSKRSASEEIMEYWLRTISAFGKTSLLVGTGYSIFSIIGFLMSLFGVEDMSVDYISVPICLCLLGLFYGIILYSVCYVAGLIIEKKKMEGRNE